MQISPGNSPLNVRGAMRLRVEPPKVAPGVDLLLTAGGDERILPDPVTRRNRYGTMATPCPDEIFLSSSTASAITPRAYGAVETAWTALCAEANGDRPGLEAWFDGVRVRLLDLFGIEGANVVLTGSGTEAELLSVAIARSVLGGPLTNIVLAPTETGSGVLRAAGGAHFLDSTPFGQSHGAGGALSGWAHADIAAAGVEIRDADGDLRAPAEVDAEARLRTHAAIEAGRSVLLHLLQTSKTGRSGLTAAAASQILAEAPQKVLIVADCCQLRCSRERVREFLARGFLVAVTGSKFFGGPPFCGALLLPAPVLARIWRLALPEGLAGYSSQLDWPPGLRAKARLRWTSQANLGLGLRWIAALSEMERFFALPDDLRSGILVYFENEIRRRADRLAPLQEIAADPPSSVKTLQSILPYVMTHPDGAPFSAAETAAIHARLRLPCATSAPGDQALAQVFHLGQPVAVGPRTALRVCASAPIVSEIAERLIGGASLGMAFAQWGRDLDALFDKWRWLMEAASAARRAAPPAARKDRRRA